MFISKLVAKLEAYDPFCLHRVNGLKAVFILELLFFVNLVYRIKDPFFYYFFIAMIGLLVEPAGKTVREKYVLVFLTLIGSIVSVLLFGILSINQTLLVFFVFFYLLIFYFLAIRHFPILIVPVPIVFSLAAYSLLYAPHDRDFYVALNHGIVTLVALVVVFSGLISFPHRYYWKIWHRALSKVLENVEHSMTRLFQGEPLTVPVMSSTIILERYSRMVFRHKNYFSILKITLYAFQLVMALSYSATFQQRLNQDLQALFLKYLGELRQSFQDQQRVLINTVDVPTFLATQELKTLYGLMRSWNYVCSVK